VEHGVEIVKCIGGVDRRVVEMVRMHHERHDGSGYAAVLPAATSRCSRGSRGSSTPTTR
jgi:hypothetical protein